MSGKNTKSATCRFGSSCTRSACQYQHEGKLSAHTAAQSRGRAPMNDSRSNTARPSSSSNSQYIRKEQSNTQAWGVSHSNESKSQQRQPPQSQPPPFVFAMLSDRSQYSLPNGRSACTLIALAAAGCLGAIPRWNRDVTSGEPDKIMEMGIAWYESISVYLPTDHCAADEAIQALQMCGEGLSEEHGLSMPFDFGVVGSQQDLLSLENIMRVFRQACNIVQEDDGRSATASNRVACLFTKPPETVMVLCSVESQADPQFLLFDSHPRPNLGLPGCSIMVYNGLRALALALLQRLPVSDIPGLDPMTYQMLNTFDLITVSVQTKLQPLVHELELDTSKPKPTKASCCEELKPKFDEIAQKMERMEQVNSRFLEQFQQYQESISSLHQTLRMRDEYAAGSRSLGFSFKTARNKIEGQTDCDAQRGEDGMLNERANSIDSIYAKRDQLPYKRRTSC